MKNISPEFEPELKKFMAGQEPSKEFMEYLEGNIPLLIEIEEVMLNDELGQLIKKAHGNQS